MSIHDPRTGRFVSKEKARKQRIYRSSPWETGRDGIEYDYILYNKMIMHLKKAKEAAIKFIDAPRSGDYEELFDVTIEAGNMIEEIFEMVLNSLEDITEDMYW